MLYDKDLHLRGEMWTLIKGNITKLESGAQKGELSQTYHSHTYRFQQKETYLIPLVGSDTIIASRRKKNFPLAWQQLSQYKKSANTKNHYTLNSQFPLIDILFITGPPNFSSSSIKECPLRCFTGLACSSYTTVVCSKLKFFASLKQTYFAGKNNLLFGLTVCKTASLTVKLISYVIMETHICHLSPVLPTPKCKSNCVPVVSWK